MAARKAHPAPPTPEAREALLAAVRTTSEPTMAKPLAKLLPPECRMAEADLQRVLDEFVAARALIEYPPKTAKGKPRYWDRDAWALARDAALDALQHAEEPLVAKKVASRLKVPLKPTEAELTQILDEFVATGRLHRLPSTTARGAARYWTRSLNDFARSELLKAVESKGPQPAANLKKALKGFSEPQIQQVLQNALADRVLWRYPPLGKAGKELLGRKPPSPEPYLRDIGTQLAKSVALLREAQVPADDLRRAVVQLVEAAGIRFAGASHPASDSPQVPSIVDLIDLMKRIEPGAARGTLVGSRDLRRVAGLSKTDFDQAVLDLARQGRLSLHRHDYPASLTPAERDELVSDGRGTYYVGMALRQREPASYPGGG